MSDSSATKSLVVDETKTTSDNSAAHTPATNKPAGKPNNVDTTHLILLICVILFWFVGAIIYLVVEKPQGMNMYLTLAALIIPVIAGVLLMLNVFGVINLGK